MTNIYSYYMYLPTLGKTRVYPIQNTLRFKYVIEPEHEGFYIKKLDGSFKLTGTHFDIIKQFSESTFLFWIYEHGTDLTGTLIYDGTINTNNNFDYNQRIVEIQDFTINYSGNTLAIMEIINDEKYIGGGNSLTTTAYLSPGFEITSYGGRIDDIIANLSGLNCTYTDFWYNYLNAPIEIKKVYLANMSTMLAYPKGSKNKCTLKRIFEILETLFKIYWYEDSGSIKFKTVNDFRQNTLDLSSLLIHKDQKKYNLDNTYFKETLKFNDNNSNPDLQDWSDTLCIEYDNNTTKILKRDLSDITTLFNINRILTGGIEVNHDYRVIAFAGGTYITYDGVNYYHNESFTGKLGITGFATSGSDVWVIDQNTPRSTNGWFLAYCNGTSLAYTPGVKSGTYYDNGYFSLATLLHIFHRDYLYAEYGNYKINGATVPIVPKHIKPFIELPDIQIVLSSVATFYDTILYKTDGDKYMISRVWEQSTELATNITTFKSFEFENTII